MKVVIVGGGAAGFFAAINLKEMAPQTEVVILEGGAEPLAKVRISGGGRCNLTNSFAEQMPLIKRYSRGEKVMRSCFRSFNHLDTIEWFESRGVETVTQEDNCVFPRSQDATQITSMLISEAKRLGVKLHCRHKVERISRLDDNTFSIDVKDCHQPILCDVVLATVGGQPTADGFSIFATLPVRVVAPLPSLFSFNLPHNPITELMGTVVENAVVSLKGSRLSGAGALLITHWGLSGPATLKLSSYAARRLSETDYKAQIMINWVGGASQESVLATLLDFIAANSKKLVGSARPYGLTARTWEHILQRANISQERRYVELGSKGINRIVASLTADEYSIDGRSAHKEEFVTCGGIAVGCVNPATMESRDCAGLYFAGEVMDVDAITGGYNLQAAWSMAYVAAQNIAWRGELQD